MTWRSLFAVGIGLALFSAPAPAETTALPLAEARALHGGPPSRYATIEAVDVRYADEGSGPAVVLIHGSYGDLSDWDGWAKLLRPHFRVVRLDMPGFGLSGPVASGDYSADQTMRIVEALVARLGIDRFAIAGTSSGGPAAFRFAATRPQLVSALIIMNSAGMAYGNAASRPNQRPFGKMTLADITVANLEGPLKSLANDDEAITPAFVRRKYDIARIEGRAEEGARIVAHYERGDPHAMLAKVRAPTLVLWGGANKALAASVAGDFAAALTRSSHVEKVVIPGGSHLLHVQLPQESGAVARAFLAKWARN